MRRILFKWRRVTFYSYPTMLYFGIVFGIFGQGYAARLIQLDSARVLAATLLLLAPALLGARLLFVITHWSAYRREPRRMWRASEGGAAMYGGLLMAVPLSVPLLAILGLSLGAFWDTASFTMLIGMIVTRVGCLLNGCCSGRPTRGWLGLNLPDDHGVWKRRVPTQLLEAAWGAVVLAGAIALWGHLRLYGALFLCVVAAYAAGRIVLEQTREEQDLVSGFALQQVLSLGFAATSLAALAVALLT